MVLKENVIYFLSTGECVLKKLDLINKNISIVHDFKKGVFLRGLCMIKDVLFIGASFTTTSKYNLQSSCIFKYNLKNTTLTQMFMAFEGAILDMQVLNEKL